MDAVRQAAPAGHDSVVLDLVTAVASRNEGVIIVGDWGGKVVLDRAQPVLFDRRIRSVRVSGSASGGLSLLDLMAQVLGSSAHDLADRDLEAAFLALTEPGEGCDRVALLVDSAHDLQLPTLRYIQLATRSTPKLSVVLAGRPGLDSMLARHEFGSLRQHVAHRLELSGPAAHRHELASTGREPRWLVALNTKSGAFSVCALIIPLMIWAMSSGPPVDHVGNAPPHAAERGQDPDSTSGAQATWARQLEPDAPTLPAQDAVEDASLPPGQEPADPDKPHPRELGPSPTQEPVSMRTAAAPSAPAVIVPALPPERLATRAVPTEASRPATRRAHVEAASAASANEVEMPRRCRDIVLNTQLGGVLSNADRLYMRNGCRSP